MSTRVTLTIAAPDFAGMSMQVELADDFERVVSILIPLDQPSSALEARNQRTFTTIDGKRVMLRPELVGVIEELEP